VTLAAGFAPISFFSRQSPDASPAQINFDAFLTQTGTVFRALPESSPAVRLKLVEVRQNSRDYPGAHQAADARNEKFSLLFCGGDGPALEQNTYIFEHPDLGRFAMFIVPARVGDDRRNYYQAIFNRLPC
jgi:hypothetical protein